MTMLNKFCRQPLFLPLAYSDFFAMEKTWRERQNKYGESLQGNSQALLQQWIKMASSLEDSTFNGEK